MKADVIVQLTAPFSLKERKGVGSTIFKYVATEDILERMNTVFKGNWSTEVKTVNTFEDQVIVCVRVWVFDPEVNQLFWHDGYASHPIQRFTTGSNAGKAMDVGNTYKAAVSKAIKTAVTRWGVALFLEGEEEETKPSTGLPFQGFSDLIPGGPSAPVSTPPAAKPANLKPEGVPFMDFPFNVDMPQGSSGPLPKETTSDMPEAEGNVSSVQLYAMESLQNIHNKTYMQLAKEALGAEYPVPTNPRELTYEVAAKIIQYGNSLR